MPVPARLVRSFVRAEVTLSPRRVIQCVELGLWLLLVGWICRMAELASPSEGIIGSLIPDPLLYRDLFSFSSLTIRFMVRRSVVLFSEPSLRCSSVSLNSFFVCHVSQGVIHLAYSIDDATLLQLLAGEKATSNI